MYLFLGIGYEVDDVLKGLDIVSLFNGDINVATELLLDPIQELVGPEDIYSEIVLEVSFESDSSLELIEDLLRRCGGVVWWGLEKLFGGLED
jgi:hypothetical protein